MNIGIDAKRVFFNNSGLGNYGRRFYLALAKNIPEDNFFLYSPRPVDDDNPYLKEIQVSNTKIRKPERKLHRLFGGSVWRTRFINSQLHKDSIDFFYGLSNEIPFGTANKSMKKIVVIHDLIFLRYPELYPAIDTFFYKKKTRYACKHADYIIAASEQTKKDIIDFYGIGKDKISVLYPCSDQMFYSEKIDDPDVFFKIGRKYIISIGAITPRKNLMKTVEALNLLKDNYKLDLVVIGTAVGLGREYLKRIQDYIAVNKLEDRVHFLGNVPYHFVPGLCRKAEMMVYPSLFEGFGMPIVEGLFSKIPVITSNGGCFPEAGGDAAEYVNPDDSHEIASRISKIMESPELRQEMVLKGIRHAEKFTQENIEQMILSFHRSISR